MTSRHDCKFIELEENAAHYFKKYFLTTCEDFNKIVADVTDQRSDSGAEVDTTGIYTKHHYNQCQEFFIRMRFNFEY